MDLDTETQGVAKDGSNTQVPFCANGLIYAKLTDAFVGCVHLSACNFRESSRGATFEATKGAARE